MTIRCSILSKGLLLVAVPLLCQLVMIGFVIKSGRQEREADELVTKAQTTLQLSERLLKQLVDVETGCRGYVLTADPDFAEPLDLATQEVPNLVESLRALLNDTPAEKAELINIENNAARWLAFQAENVRLVKEGEQGQAIKRIATRIGKQQMDHLRQQFATLQQGMDRRVNAQTEIRERNHARFWNVIVSGTITSILLAMGLAVAFMRGISRRLSIVVRNIQSLAQGKELVSPVDGRDEIAVVDQAFRQMAHTLAQSQEELTKRSHLLHSMLENMGDGVVVADEAGNFLLFNSAAEQILGVGKTDSKPEDWSDRYHVFLPDQTTVCPPDQIPLIRAIRGEEVDGAEFFIRNPHQDEGVWITVTARPLIDDRGHACGGVAVFRDDTLRKRAIREVQHAFNLVDGTRDGFFIFDAETLRFSYVNQGAVEQVGYSRDELLLMKVLDIKPEFTESQFRALIAPLLAGTVPSQTFTTIHRHQCGQDIPVEINIQCVVDSADCQSLVAVARDVTERTNAEPQLIHAREVAESANRAKSEFLAAMSHELRTPLNGILGMNELLMNTELSGKQRQFVEACSTSGKALLHQINDILDLSKIEAGKLELEIHECQLEALVYDVADVFAHNTQRSGLARRRHDDIADAAAQCSQRKSYPLHCFIDPSACVTALCDANRLRQVLVNLIGNAMKFTESGGVTVRVECVQQLDCVLTLRFSVTDTGVGIPEDRLHRLFTPFSQVDSSTSRKFGGTGLGLSICKQLVEVMGGTIGVNSQVGVGSTFWFELPLQFVTEEDFASQQRRMLVGKRVLAIDGIDRERKQIGESLQAWECPFEHVRNLAEALESVARAESAGVPFAVVLADLQLVEGDEYILLQKLAKKSRLPIIGLGANSNAETSDYLRQLGVRQVLCDPIRPSVLFDAMISVLAVTPRTAAPNQEDKQVADEPPQKLSGHILVAEDNRINQMYITELLKYCGCTSELADNGDAALTALQNQRFDLVLMDCQMPEMDGFTATREIRRREAAGELPGHLPIIALTANALQGDRERCLEAGMDEYLTKPLNAQLLETMLKKMIGWQPLTIPVTADSQSDQSFEDSPIDTQALLSRCFGNATFVVSLLDELESSSAERLGAIRHAANQQDPRATADAAHTLKGAASVLSATAVQQAAAQIEATARTGDLTEISSMVDNLARQLRHCLESLPTLRQRIHSQQKVVSRV